MLKQQTVCLQIGIPRMIRIVRYNYTMEAIYYQLLWSLKRSILLEKRRNIKVYDKFSRSYYPTLTSTKCLFTHLKDVFKQESVNKRESSFNMDAKVNATIYFHQEWLLRFMVNEISNTLYIYIYIYICVCVCVCVIHLN